MKPAARIKSLWARLLAPLPPQFEAAVESFMAAAIGALAGFAVGAVVGRILGFGVSPAVAAALIGAVLAALNRRYILNMAARVGGVLDFLFFFLRIP